MTPAFENLLQELKHLPGLGFRSAERIAMHLLVEQPETLEALMESMVAARAAVRRCESCGNLAESAECAVCEDERRNPSSLCVVEHVPDLIAIERSSAWKGKYHVLHGKLSPIHGIGPEDLNFQSLIERIEAGGISEFVLALSNDIEGQATCHYIQEEIVGDRPIKVTRIGFGLPSGGGVTYADSVTLRSALEGRRDYL
ncbi:MAG: recombination mediator RecR [Opitutae bacterium]|nr:recombination mediator RecR [Opitutae bacterium]MDG2345038.1 recombination mediator RecR [Opitutae bacterium]